MKQFIRLQNTEGNEVIINTDYTVKITAQPKTHNTYERTMIELSVDYGVNIFTYLSTDAIYDKIESLVQDYKAKQGKEFIKHIEAQPLEKPKQYLCYVQGKALPKHIHKTLEQAKQEAQRLCRKELTKVSVLEVVAEYEAEVLVKEVL